MAQKLENDKDILAIEITFDDMLKCHFGPICDSCNNISTNPKKNGIYIPVLNHVMCKNCYNKFIKTAEHYDEDNKYEEDHYNYYANILGLMPVTPRKIDIEL